MWSVRRDWVRTVCGLSADGLVTGFEGALGAVSVGSLVFSDAAGLNDIAFEDRAKLVDPRALVLSGSSMRLFFSVGVTGLGVMLDWSTSIRSARGLDCTANCIAEVEGRERSRERERC